MSIVGTLAISVLTLFHPVPALVRSIPPDAHRMPPCLIDPSCVPSQDHGLSRVTDAANDCL